MAEKAPRKWLSSAVFEEKRYIQGKEGNGLKKKQTGEIQKSLWTQGVPVDVHVASFIWARIAGVEGTEKNGFQYCAGLSRQKQKSTRVA